MFSKPKYEHSRDIRDDWIWEKEQEDKWFPAPEGWQTFYQHWHELSSANIFDTVTNFPYTLSLSPSPKEAPTFVLKLTDDKLLVRESYDLMFKRISELRETRWRSGVVVTGQSGIGKSAFVAYIAIILLVQNQPFVLCRGRAVYLFFDGKVHKAKSHTNFHFDDIPTSKGRHPMWALVDTDESREGITGGITTCSIFPTHIASPNPDHYRGWVKERDARIWGLPLWSREELIAGLECLYNYDQLLAEVEEIITKNERPATGNRHVRYIWHARTSLLEQRGLKLGHKDEMNLSTIAVSARDVIVAMLDLAITTVGFAVRDVYTAVGQYPTIFESETAELTFEDLHRLAESFAEQGFAHTVPHAIIAVSPIDSVDMYKDDSFTITFKSTKLMEKMLQRPEDTENAKVAEFSGLLRAYPRASALGGVFFEVMAHHYICGGPRVKLGEMKRVQGSARTPTYSTVPDGLGFVQLQPRKTKSIDFDRNVSFDIDNVYYRLGASNKVSFDSFFIEYDDRKRRGIVWALRMTTAMTHVDPWEDDISFIVGKVSRQMAERWSSKSRWMAAAKKRPIIIKHVLVCPEDGQTRMWNLSLNYNFTHRREFYWLPIPITRR
ncbi:hypothetical protein BV25DRAFT_1826240 [Artomyces pyxidatus]|uniref:Uncharacterized protein n=1 Tax=Artomyces pyxidatus TaxID=48021 RepID=A0ACB8SZJ2_9AGAM|nr:hypothetical protein BV25DRAFT_1826240 [Artomyces pyxidatus]